MNSLTFIWQNKIKNRTILTENGHLHCPTGPAVFTEDGNFQEFWVEGELHNPEGPAVIDKFLGRTEWWIRGKRTRLDGPAVVVENGLLVSDPRTHIEFWFDGKRHRITGPAVVRSDGTEEFWIDGKQLSFIEFKLIGEKLNKDLIESLLGRIESRHDEKLLASAMKRSGFKPLDIKKIIKRAVTLRTLR